MNSSHIFFHGKNGCKLYGNLLGNFQQVPFVQLFYLFIFFIFIVIFLFLFIYLFFFFFGF